MSQVIQRTAQLAGMTLKISEDGLRGVLTIPSQGTQQEVILDQFELNVQCEQIDVTTFGSSCRSYIPGPTHSQISISLSGGTVAHSHTQSESPVELQPISYRRSIDWEQR